MCVCIELYVLAATTKKQPGNMVLHLRFQRNYNSFAAILLLFQSLCALWVLCGMFVRICSGFTWQTNNKSFLISVLLNVFFLCVVFLLNTFVMHFSALETEFSEWKKTERNDESNRSHGQWNIYCVGIFVCLHANRDYWSWWIVVFFLSLFLFRISLANKCATIQSKTDIKDNRVSMRVFVCVSAIT